MATIVIFSFTGSLSDHLRHLVEAGLLARKQVVVRARGEPRYAYRLVKKLGEYLWVRRGLGWCKHNLPETEARVPI